MQSVGRKESMLQRHASYSLRRTVYFIMQVLLVHLEYKVLRDFKVQAGTQEGGEYGYRVRE
jgi:hypothetical protein